MHFLDKMIEIYLKLQKRVLYCRDVVLSRHVTQYRPWSSFPYYNLTTLLSREHILHPWTRWAALWIWEHSPISSYCKWEQSERSDNNIYFTKRYLFSQEEWSAITNYTLPGVLDIISDSLSLGVTCARTEVFSAFLHQYSWSSRYYWNIMTWNKIKNSKIPHHRKTERAHINYKCKIIWDLTMIVTLVSCIYWELKQI
jgi:hypothetical protein